MTTDLTDSDAQDDVAFSRSAGLLSQSGNADSELKTRVSDEAADDFRREARKFGVTTSELLRVMVYERLYGVDGVARMTANSVALMAGKGPIAAHPAQHTEAKA